MVKENQTLSASFAAKETDVGSISEAAARENYTLKILLPGQRRTRKNVQHTRFYCGPRPEF